MKPISLFAVILSACIMLSFGKKGEKKTGSDFPKTSTAVPDTFKYETDQFADIRILRYTIPGFESLTLKQKELLYYLSEAALAGKDIIWDQNYKYNLTVRKTLETIVSSYKGDKRSEDWNKFMVYAKRVWFSNGIHHHY